LSCKDRIVKNAALILSVVVLLVGCASPPPKPTVTTDPAEQALVVAGNDVRSSLLKLAEAEQYDKLGTRPGTPDFVPNIPGLNDVVAMPWDGPLEPIVSKIAQEGGYRPEFSGKAPTLPIMVSLGNKPSRAGQLLRSLGIQAGNRADIVVDPAHRVVEVVYANTGL
jgi:defect-in-organelle-trafficking protein DotD